MENVLSQAFKLSSKTTMDEYNDLNVDVGVLMEDIKTAIEYQGSILTEANEYFMKMYICDDDKWFFHDYCYLKNDSECTTVITRRSKLTMITINNDNASNQIKKHGESNNYILITNGMSRFLLYNPYPAVIKRILSMYEILE